MDLSSNELIEKQFLEKMQNKVKSQMIFKYFRNDITHFDVPLFNEFSGKKQITPYRNTSCMTFKCIYDLTELLVKYKNSAYSNYLSFICHTCRKMLYIQDFYKDVELERIINKVWPKYNLNDQISCSAVKIQKSGGWDPILPNYLGKLEKNLNKDHNIDNSNQQSSRYEEEVALQNVEVYESIPMLDEFDVDEFKRLLSELVDDDQPRLDNEIILKRYNQQLKWGEFTHLRGQTAFIQAPMAIYVSYMADYYQRKVGVKRPMAFTVIKVTSFDTYRFRAQFYYVTDNFSTLPGPIADNCKMAIFVLNFDDRWMLVIFDIKTLSIKLLDFLEPQISRYRQDELYEMSMYIVEQVCPPLKVKRQFGLQQQERDQLNVKLIKEQLEELKKKVQYYTDCGHQLAQYLYYFVKQEIDQQSNQIPQIQTKIGEKDLFTARVCWLFLKMAQQRTLQIPFYQFKPEQLRPQTNNDSIDNLMLNQSQMGNKKLLNSWDFSRNETKNNVSSTVGNILQDMNPIQGKSTPIGSVEKSQIRASKYWNMPVQRILLEPSPKSIIKKQGTFRFVSETSAQSPAKSAHFHPKMQNQKEEPFFSMPRWQLQQFLENQKQQIIDAYSQQAIAKQYYLQKDQAEQRKGMKTGSLQYQTSQYQDPNQDLDEELKKLQIELGLDDQDLAELDIGSYDGMMHLLEQRGTQYQTNG